MAVVMLWHGAERRQERAERWERVLFMADIFAPRPMKGCAGSSWPLELGQACRFKENPALSWPRKVGSL